MHRFRFVGKRLLQAIPLLLAMTTTTFLLLHLVPADPAQAMAGLPGNDEVLSRLRAEYGLDRPLVEQYLDFVAGLLRGDLGLSWRTLDADRQTSVSSVIASRWEVTAWLVVVSLVLILLLAVPLATLAATHRDRAADAAVRAGTTFGIGMPAFWVGIMLIVLVAAPTGWFPVGGQFGAGPLDHLRAVFLPSLALALVTAPVVVRSLRSGLIASLDADYVAAARSVGVTGTRLVRRHVLRNSLVPTMSLLGILVGYLSFGTVVLEKTFDLPGLGHTMVEASLARDYPVVLGLTLVFGVCVVVARLIADVAIVLLDPRVSLE
jgi:peptide/nickel transport system permease protein